MSPSYGGGWPTASAAARNFAVHDPWRRIVSAGIRGRAGRGLGYPLGLPLGPTAALFLFAASRDDEDPWTRRSSGMVVAFLLVYLAATSIGEGGYPWSELFHVGLAWAAAWFAGERTRLRREQIAELKERALRAEREAERERRLAAAEERARIARDLHDAAGHAINVIAVRAGTARLRRDSERSQAALEAIEELARKTVGEIDQIVGTLRDRGSANEAVDAPLSLASLDTLVARHAAAGLDVSLASEGEPRQLESAVDQAAYRILQEALTNAARHGTGAARVELAFGNAALELTISNAALVDGASRSNGGHGLIGMRERATLLGGTLEVERATGSLCVRARLPTEVIPRDAGADRGRRRPHARRPRRAARGRVRDRDRRGSLDRSGGRRASASAPARRGADGRPHARPGGIEATRELTRALPRARVLILTTFEQDDYVFGALRAGASGFLLKRSRPEELIAAVHTIAAGDSLLSPSVTRRVIDRMAQQPMPELAAQAKLDELTRREREVLDLIARGLSNREIAAQLFVEESTVRTHAKRIQMKLQLRDRVQIVIFAYESGLNRPAPTGSRSPTSGRSTTAS